MVQPHLAIQQARTPPRPAEALAPPLPRHELVPQLLEEPLHARPLDGLERLPVDTRGTVVGLGERIRRAKRLQLTNVDVQAPEAPGRVGLRLGINPPPKILQTDGGRVALVPGGRANPLLPLVLSRQC